MVASLISVCLLAAPCLYVKLWTKAVASKQRSSKVSVGFFHPYCNTAGSGDRVLWN